MGVGGDQDNEGENSPEEVGHNIYILAYQLAQHKEELKEALERAREEKDSIQYYAERTGQIEVRVCTCIN